MPKRTKDYHSWLLVRLTNPRTAANYLNAAMNDSTEMFLTALRNVAEARTMAKVAQEAGVNRESLYRALSEEGNPRLSTLSSVLSVLGLKIFVGVEAQGGGSASSISGQNEPVSTSTGNTFDLSSAWTTLASFKTSRISTSATRCLLRFQTSVPENIPVYVFKEITANAIEKI